MKIALLGSTGSIGKNVLKVALHTGAQVVALAAHSNSALLEEQAHIHHPTLIAVYDLEQARLLQKRLPHVRVVGGIEGLCEVASYAPAEMVISAIVGTAGLLPTAEAIKAGKRIGLANKETLVAGGSYIMPLVQKQGVTLIPIDSEHSALFQCLQGEDPQAVRRLILTASGGPFRTWSPEQLSKVTVKEALTHPNFSMGAKITVDSSTLMNKGLEVIEAYWLFGTERIEVVIHPQQKIHSMVEYIDGSILAQMSEPDMLFPIQYALTYPKRLKGFLPPYDFIKNSHLDFHAPNLKTFRCLDLAYAALHAGGTMPCYMNGANEVLVQRFLNHEIRWGEIGEKLEALMERYTPLPHPSLEDILEADRCARAHALD